MAKFLKLKNEGVRRMLYAVLAALLCFVGPTYFVAIMSNIIPQLYAMAAGFVSFLIGIFFMYRLVEE
ncbi:hypothetical protein E3J51_05110 [Candidatus Bathyarchaeota archaeon]|nr:MAG: hypothetical protein E3J51_05110 [Candidatus Bathyarchaeota archaeon]